MTKKHVQTEFLLEIKEGRVLIRAHQGLIRKVILGLVLVCGLVLLSIALFSPDIHAQALTALIALLKSALSSVLTSSQ